MKIDTDTLKDQIAENPLAAIGIGATAITAVAKLLDAVGARKSRKIWAKEVARRAGRSTLLK